VELLLSQRCQRTDEAGKKKGRGAGALAPSHPTAHALSALVALPCAFNEEGDTAMIFAARGNYPGIVKMLLAHQVPSAVPNKSGRTALHEAAASGLEEVRIVDSWGLSLSRASDGYYLVSCIFLLLVN